MKNSAPRLNAALPKDVHDALSYVLKAYSIFTPNPQLPLFQAVLVNPDRNNRHKSPQATPLNLDAIVYEATNIPEMKPPPEGQYVIDILSKEITERLDPPLNKPMCSDLLDIEPEVSVSVSSLVRAEVSGIVPEVNIAFGGRFSKEKRRAAKLKLTSQRSRRYSGSYLGIFLWEHGEFLFRRMLLYLHRDLGINNGDRRILAFVTKHIYGTVSISTSEFRDTNAGFAGPVPIAGCLRSTHESEANCANMGGVIGVHFITFPVEKVEDHMWRFYRPIEIVDEENTGSDSSILFQTASKWASGEKGVHLYNATDTKEVCSDHMESSEHAQRADSSGTESSTTSQDIFSSQDYQDVSLPRHRSDWIDVDLGESVEDLARRQVTVAKHYMGMKDEGKNKLISHLLGSAVAAGNLEAVPGLFHCSDKEAESSNLGTETLMPSASRGKCLVTDRDVYLACLPRDKLTKTKRVDCWRVMICCGVLTGLFFLGVHAQGWPQLLTLGTAGVCFLGAFRSINLANSKDFSAVVLLCVVHLAVGGALTKSVLGLFSHEMFMVHASTMLLSSMLYFQVGRIGSALDRVAGVRSARVELFIGLLVFAYCPLLFYYDVLGCHWQIIIDKIHAEQEWAMSPNPDFAGISYIHNESVTCSLPRFFSS